MALAVAAVGAVAAVTAAFEAAVAAVAAAATAPAVMAWVSTPVMARVSGAPLARSSRCVLRCWRGERRVE